MRVLERPSDDHLVLEFINVDCSFVNALRRILLAEVPTVALENVYMWNNNSVVHDEVLAHRLGLIPLQIDARLLDEPDETDPTPTDRNTVVFRLSVSCSKADAKRDKVKRESNMSTKDDIRMMQEEEKASVSNQTELEEAAMAAATSSDRPKLQYPKDRPYTKHVYSKDLIWVPQGEQEEMFTEVIRPIHDDILIAKLRPGQCIELEAHGQRGIGKDHAKYSPVCTASYRLMPQIELLEPVYDDVAKELVHIYEPGVFKLIPTDPNIDPPGCTVKAIVCNPYACTMSRNYMRNPQLASAIRMTRLSNHFIFSIESVGMYSPAVLLAEAIRVLQRKCQNIMDLVDEHTLRSDVF
jgi:DNA-directed RNA polymerases I and III subunit RPAC1